MLILRVLVDLVTLALIVLCVFNLSIDEVDLHGEASDGQSDEVAGFAAQGSDIEASFKLHAALHYLGVEALGARKIYSKLVNSRRHELIIIRIVIEDRQLLGIKWM